MMICAICKNGTIKDGLATVTLTRSNSTIVIRDVPARICPNCGEYYLSAEMTQKIEALADDAISKGAEVEIIRFVA